MELSEFLSLPDTTAASLARWFEGRECATSMRDFFLSVRICVVLSRCSLLCVLARYGPANVLTIGEQCTLVRDAIARLDIELLHALVQLHFVSVPAFRHNRSVVVRTLASFDERKNPVVLDILKYVLALRADPCGRKADALTWAANRRNVQFIEIARNANPAKFHQCKYHVLKKAVRISTPILRLFIDAPRHAMLNDIRVFRKG